MILSQKRVLGHFLSAIQGLERRVLYFLSVLKVVLVFLKEETLVCF